MSVQNILNKCTIKCLKLEKCNIFIFLYPSFPFHVYSLFLRAEPAESTPSMISPVFSELHCIPWPRLKACKGQFTPTGVTSRWHSKMLLGVLRNSVFCQDFEDDSIKGKPSLVRHIWESLLSSHINNWPHLHPNFNPVFFHNKTLVFNEL